ncbi:hypothetical protein BB560_000315 [Smittium megazygosporum]|uniref:Transcription regulator Rua1 C-terminal domain-containing protein n=1 Tax=Smittium megazygosporum TaxID=133381 RepID=A0A2T9ZKS8_9FUNG|nr:hypothetical protein BB560_000315 [Smittium megazygosporum]
MNGEVFTNSYKGLFVSENLNSLLSSDNISKSSINQLSLPGNDLFTPAKNCEEFDILSLLFNNEELKTPQGVNFDNLTSFSLQEINTESLPNNPENLNNKYNFMFKDSNFPQVPLVNNENKSSFNQVMLGGMTSHVSDSQTLMSGIDVNNCLANTQLFDTTLSILKPENPDCRPIYANEMLSTNASISNKTKQDTKSLSINELDVSNLFMLDDSYNVASLDKVDIHNNDILKEESYNVIQNNLLNRIYSQSNDISTTIKTESSLEKDNSINMQNFDIGDSFDYINNNHLNLLELLNTKSEIGSVATINPQTSESTLLLNKLNSSCYTQPIALGNDAIFMNSGYSSSLITNSDNSLWFSPGVDTGDFANLKFNNIDLSLFQASNQLNDPIDYSKKIDSIDTNHSVQCNNVCTNVLLDANNNTMQNYTEDKGNLQSKLFGLEPICNSNSKKRGIEIDPFISNKNIKLSNFTNNSMAPGNQSQTYPPIWFHNIDPLALNVDKAVVPSCTEENEEDKPRRQNVTSDNDKYTPLWIRYSGPKREGMCRYCLPYKWLQLKNSAYRYHMQSFHGISSQTKQFFNPPKITVSGKNGLVQEWERMV